MKGAYFVFTLWVMAILGFIGSLMSIEYLNTRLSLHHAYHKALQRSMLASDYDREFKEVFDLMVPKNVSYDVELVNHHEYPRLLSYRVRAKSSKGYSIHYEETMIEERR